VIGLRQRTVVERDDGSLGPLLRISEDMLAPGVSYGVHAHRAVDVVAVVLAGSLRHEWGERPVLRAGDVAVLTAGNGLEHDERAGDDGARVLQCYLRPVRPDAGPRHVVHRRVDGWVDLDRPDARLWCGRGTAPPGLVLAIGPDGVTLPASPVAGPAVVWSLDTARPAWAAD
jgi:quercetin 2,3-dioxygenase